jgi:hypothetical protein
VVLTIAGQLRVRVFDLNQFFEKLLDESITRDENAQRHPVGNGEPSSSA